MRDGYTVKRGDSRPGRDTDDLAAWNASLIVVAGGPEGHEHLLDRPRLVVGRGPGADLAFDDDQMSQQHAAVEFASGRFHVTDLGSTNGTRINGAAVESCEVSHGDRIELGGTVLQILIEKRDSAPRTYVVDDE
jgi:pSer/pThr/pTyr-binding forkhead associated (FHA) protein